MKTSDAVSVVKWGAGLREPGSFEPIMIGPNHERIAAKYFCATCGKPVILGDPHTTPRYRIHDISGRVSPKFRCARCATATHLVVYRWAEWVRKLTCAEPEEIE